MTMSSDLEERAALDAVGALTADERADLRRALSSADPDARTAVAQLYDLAGARARPWAAGSDRGPSPHLRDRLLARVSRGGNFSVLATEGRFHETSVAGIVMKVLSHDPSRDAAVLLLKARPGSRYPPHHHGGAEECYVLSGDVIVAGRTLHAGDFHHADAGSDHGELSTETGAEVLLFVAASDYGL